MLIGLDFYWTIVMREVRQGIHGLVAISSKLGWLLSRPISAHNPVVTSSHLIIQGLDGHPKDNNKHLLTVLKDFRETEAIGITDTYQGTTKDENSLKEINFVAG